MSLVLVKSVSPTKKTFTYLSRSAPYGSNRAQVCLDAALATAVFEQTVNYVFLDDGVYQLLKDQNADKIFTKTIGNAIETLELYGIQNIFIKEDSLRERNLSIDDLAIKVEPLSNKKLAELIDGSDSVINL